MTAGDHPKAMGARDDRSGPRYVSAPPPHAGLGKALRDAFAPGRALPDDFSRLLGHLR